MASGMQDVDLFHTQIADAKICAAAVCALQSFETYALQACSQQ